MAVVGNILHTVRYMLKHSDRRDRERGVACHRCPVHLGQDVRRCRWPKISIRR